ncbi:MAG: hypothetical protein CBD97_00725 [Pelagibacteraceae bacterium TMED237]|nr:mechanosensitive ion channel protein MscS [Candidatus Neomarinimicrobiota bacterium]OUW96741.1 MAG: hypothetical protein CBD97_00725 [Pelagibacteraceae bacterium TMED237]
MEYIIEYFVQLYTNQYFFVLAVSLLAISSYLIMRFFVLKVIFRFLNMTSNKFDDILITTGFFNRLSFAVPLIVVYVMTDIDNSPQNLSYRIFFVLFVVIMGTIINSVLNAFNQSYLNSKYSKRLNIKSYIQIIKLIINGLVFIIVVAILINKSPFYLLSGLGALTAVLMLVFKDTILSFISSVQISSNDLFKVGDWLETEEFKADGEVVDIALHTIKIQNWDKTVTVIPTHKLLDSSFKNWRGMTDSGGRRIKRSINIDLNSIKFLNEDMIERLKKIDLLSDYLNNKMIEIKKYNKSDAERSLLNVRNLTNIGTYRAYIREYLNNNSNISKDMTFLIRQLPPSKNGLPIEIYVFSNNTNWVEYESIQSDIFDYLLASINQFDLKLFQNPTGSDFNKSNIA